MSYISKLLFLDYLLIKNKSFYPGYNLCVRVNVVYRMK